MSTKQVLKLIFLHCLIFFVGFGMFIISFRLPLFGNIEVLFYRGIVLLIFVCAIMAGVILILKKVWFSTLLTYRDLVLSITIIMSFSMLFFTHLPVTADRSVSVFLLGYMNNNSDKILTVEDMDEFFISRYVYSYGAMERRINEQITSGNIVRDQNGYKITDNGKKLIKLYDIIADIFGIDKKFISPH